jgi:hypothetical protein
MAKKNKKKTNAEMYKSVRKFPIQPSKVFVSKIEKAKRARSKQITDEE